MDADPWEKVRHLTLDQLITWAKLRGSAFGLTGHTTPEHWRFAFYCAIGSTPANEAAVDLVVDLDRELQARGAPATKTHNPRHISADLMSLQQDIHEEHHTGPPGTCQGSFCIRLSELVLKAGGMP